MLQKSFFSVIAVVMSAYAGDTFLNSCQKKWNADIANMKSFRSDMVQNMTVNMGKEITSSQNIKIMYLNLDKQYMRIESEVSGFNSVVVFRGDSMYVRSGENKWMPGQQSAFSNPLMGSIEALGKSNLKFIKESEGVRLYRDSANVDYKIQTKTCRLLEAENPDMKTSWEFKLINGMDIPVKNAMNVKKNSAKIEIEFKNLLINQGVTKSFFEVK